MTLTFATKCEEVSKAVTVAFSKNIRNNIFIENSVFLSRVL